MPTTWFDLTPVEQFELASKKFSAYFKYRRRLKSKKWASRLAHASFSLHPELREERSLERYFVAKLGRQQGHRGEQLTLFVESAYQSGLADYVIKVGFEAHELLQSSKHNGGSTLSS